MYKPPDAHERLLAPLAEPGLQVVNRLAGDAQQSRTLFDGVALREPEQGLGTAVLLGEWHLEQGFQLCQLMLAEDERCHRFTWATEAANQARDYSTCQRTFGHLLSVFS